MKRMLSISGATLVLLWSLPCRAEDFVFEVAEPRFRVTLPNIPRMKMDPHPMNASQPHLRLLGSEGPYTVAVFVPAAAAGMTARECASAIVRSLAARPGVPPPDQIYKARLNDHTYVAIYASRFGDVVNLHAHFMSAAGGKHCIEVHAAKVSVSEDDLDPWLNGFGNANVEAY